MYIKNDVIDPPSPSFLSKAKKHVEQLPVAFFAELKENLEKIYRFDHYENFDVLDFDPNGGYAVFYLTNTPMWNESLCKAADSYGQSEFYTWYHSLCQPETDAVDDLLIHYLIQFFSKHDSD